SHQRPQGARLAGTSNAPDWAVSVHRVKASGLGRFGRFLVGGVEPWRRRLLGLRGGCLRNLVLELARCLPELLDGGSDRTPDLWQLARTEDDEHDDQQADDPPVADETRHLGAYLRRLRPKLP